MLSFPIQESFVRLVNKNNPTTIPLIKKEIEELIDDTITNHKKYISTKENVASILLKNNFISQKEFNNYEKIIKEEKIQSENLDNFLVYKTKKDINQKINYILDTIDLCEKHKILAGQVLYPVGLAEADFLGEKIKELLPIDKPIFNYEVSEQYNNICHPKTIKCNLLDLDFNVSESFKYLLSATSDKDELDFKSTKSRINYLIKEINKANVHIEPVVLNKIFKTCEAIKLDMKSIYDQFNEKVKTEISDKIACAFGVEILGRSNQFYLDVFENYDNFSIHNPSFPIDISNILDIMKINKQVLDKIPKEKLTLPILNIIKEKYPNEYKNFMEDCENKSQLKTHTTALKPSKNQDRIR